MVSPIKAALIDEAVRKDGFLGEGFDAVIQDCRKQHAEWFDLANSVNKFGMRLLWSLKPRKTSNQQLLVTILYGRCLSAFQTTILLAERGLVLEARYVLRAMLETTFALVATARDADFCQRYVDDDEYRLLDLVKACLRLEPAMRSFHALDEQDLRKRKQDAEQNIKSRKLKPLKVKDVADAASMLGHYETSYRLLSNTAHASVRDLDYHIVATKDQADIEKLGWGPQTGKSADVIMQACDDVIISAYAVLQLFERPELNNAHAALHRRFEQLLGKL